MRRRSYKKLWQQEQHRAAVAKERGDGFRDELDRVRRVLHRYADSHVIPHLPQGTDAISLHPVEWEAMKALMINTSRLITSDVEHGNIFQLSWRGRPLLTRNEQ